MMMIIMMIKTLLQKRKNWKKLNWKKRLILLTVIFYDNGVNDMDLCSDDNTYTNQQNQQFNPVEIHHDVNEQVNSHQDPSDYEV